MPLSFPSNPTVNQTVTTGGRVYRWNGAAWEFAGAGGLSATVTIPGSGDQYWSNTLLLLKGDGNLTDSGPAARSVTAYGNAAATTSTSKYGTGCLSFDGASGSYMALPQSSDWALTGSWTIEGWAYITSTGTAGLLTTMIADAGLGADGSLVIAPEGCWIFARDFASNNQLSWTLPTNAWAHFAFVSDAGTLRAYVNGVQASSMTQTIALTSQKLWLGSRFYDLQQYNFAGKLDDIRITKACRYPNGTTFTPPTATYVTGAYTAPQTIPVSFTGGTSPVLADDRWNLLLPSAPTGLTATAGNAQVSLSWTAPSATYIPPITDYVVQFKTAAASTWNTFSDGTSTATSATVTGLTNGTAYVFRVAAVNGVGTGAYTAATSNVTPGIIVPIDYLVVAGGGGGGTSFAGGGGAGGMRTGTASVATGSAIAVVVGGGGGGAAGTADRYSGTSGSNSIFATVVSTGGGGGGGESKTGNAGGSGGGASRSSGAGGAGISGQGYRGGNSTHDLQGAGGGGAAAQGEDSAQSSYGSAGGSGASSSATGASVVYAGGGGGGGFYNLYGPGGNGGSGGGGKGGGYNNPNDLFAGENGAVSKGSGGGGGGYGTLNPQGAVFGAGGSGGSGIVVLRSLAPAASTTGSPAVTQDGSYNVYTFTGTGSITF